MDLKKRRADLDQAMQKAQQELAGWAARVQQIAGAISENEAMQREGTDNGSGSSGVSAGDQGKPA